MSVLATNARGWNSTYVLAFVPISCLRDHPMHCFSAIVCVLLLFRSYYTQDSWCGDQEVGVEDQTTPFPWSFCLLVWDHTYLGLDMCSWFSLRNIAHHPFSPAASGWSLAHLVPQTRYLVDSSTLGHRQGGSRRWEEGSMGRENWGWNVT